MKLPLATLPVWVTVLVGAAVVGGLILAVLELFVFSKPSRVRCAVGQHLVTARHALRGLWSNNQQDDGSSSGSARKSGKRRRPRSLIIDFPNRLVALALLAVLFAFTGFYGLTLFFRAPATLGFNASFSESSPVVIETNTAAPTVGMHLPVRAMVDPPKDRMSSAAVVIAGPSTTRLSDCNAHTAKKKIDGYSHGAQARILLAGFESESDVEVECILSVEHRIRRLEKTRVALTRADASTTEEQPLYLVPPRIELGQEKAEALAEEEVRTSAALWQPSSMRSAPGAFRKQGDEWPLLDPGYPHRFSSEPRRLTKTLHQLEDTRVQSSKIVTLSGVVVTSRPVTQEIIAAKEGGRRAIRQVYAIGQEAGEQGGWCTTTRSTVQRPLRDGDYLKVRAAVIEWGRSQESGGIAVMLNCPAVKILDSAARAVTGSQRRYRRSIGSDPLLTQHERFKNAP